MSAENVSARQEPDSHPEHVLRVQPMHHSPATPDGPTRADGVDRPTPKPRREGPLTWLLKWAGRLFGLALVLVPALTCALESWLTHRQDVFVFWGQLFSLIPGLPGKYVRKCYYFLTL